jgi:hypothetical protein
VNPKEVHEVFQPDPRNCKEINEYHFVRIKRGVYEGDLGLIQKIDTDSSNVIVYVVPRLRPRRSKKQKQSKMSMRNSFIEDKIDVGAETSHVEIKKKERAVILDNKRRPVPHLFDPDEHEDQGVITVNSYGGRHISHGSQKEMNVKYR